MRDINKTDEWKKLILDYRSSGLTAKAWSQLNKKSINALHYWNKKLKKAESNGETEQQWGSIALKEQSVAKAIILKVDTIAIEVSAGFDKNILMDVLSVIQSYDRINRF